MSRTKKRSKAVVKKPAVKSRPKLQKAPTKTAKPKAKKGKKSMSKKHENEPDRHAQEVEGKKQAKEAEKDSIYGETPEPGSLDPGKTTMANPPPQNVVIPPIEPTDDPMATPAAGPLPNPPSRPGGDYAGDPNVSPTGQKLDPDHPDYRKDYEGQHQPDHRSAEEKKAFPRDEK